MPPPLLFDLSKLDLNKLIINQEGIHAIIPQRYEMAQLDGIIHIEDPTTIIGVKYVRDNEWWCRGHIPGRPLMPGVLMIECAAQLCAFWAMKKNPEVGFMGFAKCDETRFRGTIVPPADLYMIANLFEHNRRRIVGRCQGVVNGTLIFESLITGMPV
jgi:3-hydroxyacyl-[acyl-carrier-protein] dehydratase